MSNAALFRGVGNLTKRTDRNDNIRDFTYSFAHGTPSNYRITDGDWSTVSNSAHTNEFDWTYTSEGWLDEVRDNDSTINYDYDTLGRVTTITTTYTEESPGIETAPATRIVQTWDHLNRRTSVETAFDDVAVTGKSYVLDSLTEYTYDKKGQVKTIIQTDADTGVGLSVEDKRVDFAYNGIGQYTDIDRYENTVTTGLVAATDYAYDAFNRLTDLGHSRTGCSKTALLCSRLPAGDVFAVVLPVESNVERNRFLFLLRKPLWCPIASDS